MVPKDKSVNQRPGGNHAIIIILSLPEYSIIYMIEETYDKAIEE